MGADRRDEVRLSTTGLSTASGDLRVMSEQLRTAWRTAERALQLNAVVFGATEGAWTFFRAYASVAIEAGDTAHLLAGTLADDGELLRSAGIDHVAEQVEHARVIGSVGGQPA